MTVKKYYSITELTREFGVSTRTLRFYEDEGLLHPERRGRTRLYRAADRRFLQEILRGRRILADQMEFLLASVPRSSRLHA